MQTLILSNALSLLTGVILAWFGASYAHRRQRRSEKEDEQKQLRFRIYMKLMELHGEYFWIVSADARKQKRKTMKVWGLAYQISDMVRLLDDADQTERIMRVLFDESLCNTSSETYERLGQEIKRMGQTVNAAYAAVISKIQENETSLDFGRVANAPGKLFR